MYIRNWSTRLSFVGDKLHIGLQAGYSCPVCNAGFNGSTGSSIMNPESVGDGRCVRALQAGATRQVACVACGTLGILPEQHRRFLQNDISQRLTSVALHEAVKQWGLQLDPATAAHLPRFRRWVTTEETSGKAFEIGPFDNPDWT